MDYEAALDVFFRSSPEGAPVPTPVANARPPRRPRDASEPIAMHSVWSPTDWSPMGALTDVGQRLRDKIEARTDAQEQPIIEAIGPQLDAVGVGAIRHHQIAHRPSKGPKYATNANRRAPNGDADIGRVS